jgi:hypothetical protein
MPAVLDREEFLIGGQQGLGFEEVGAGRSGQGAVKTQDLGFDVFRKLHTLRILIIIFCCSIGRGDV